MSDSPHNADDKRLSVIVPLADDEKMRPNFSSDMPNDTEIIFASRRSPPADWKDGKSKWLVCERSGRAAQMNIAAAAGGGRFLWFVHADTRLPGNAAEKLSRAIAAKPLALHYFDLYFYDGGWRMALNGLGVRLRCAIFKNPFGDQAFCVSKEIFEKIGGFPEDAPYGEDHWFVLQAARHGARPSRIGVAVGTSARRYITHGWGETTLLYQRLWYRQWRQFREGLTNLPHSD